MKYAQIVAWGPEKIPLNEKDEVLCDSPLCRMKIFFVKNPNHRLEAISEQENGTFIRHFKDCKDPNKFSHRNY
jgi:hypothetical protein